VSPNDFIILKMEVALQSPCQLFWILARVTTFQFTYTLEPSRGVTLHLNGSYAVRATDDAPFLTASGGQAMLSTYARSFFPWNVRASLAIALGDGLTLEPTGEVGHTAFYSWATGGLQITYHFKTARGTAW